MSFSKAYWKTYNRMLITDTNKLLDIVLISNNNFLKTIAIRVLIDDNRLLTLNDSRILILLIEKLNVEDIWYLASFDQKYLVSSLAKEKILMIIDKTFDNESKIIYLKR